MQRLSQVILGRSQVTYNIESNNSGSLPRRLRSQHIYILEQNSSRAISNLQYVYSFMVSLKDFHILWVINVLHTTNNKKITDHDTLAKQIMSLLCTAQTVWNKGLKKHWFPIVATYGTCIMGRWTCLWSGTCSIIIILHHKVRDKWFDELSQVGAVIWFSVAGNGDAYLLDLRLFEGETLIWRGQ